MDTILVVDDESDIREVVRYALSREGFRVVEAEDGHAQRAAARREVREVSRDVLRLVVSCNSPIASAAPGVLPYLGLHCTCLRRLADLSTPVRVYQQCSFSLGR